MSDRKIKIYKGTLRDILEGISGGLNGQLKEAFFDVVNGLEKYNPTTPDKETLEKTKKIIEFFGEFVSQSRGLNNLNKLNNESLLSLIKENLNKYLDGNLESVTELVNTLKKNLASVSITIHHPTVAKQPKQISQNSSVTFSNMWAKLFNSNGKVGNVGNVNSITGTKMTPQELESIFDIIYSGKDQGKNGYDLTKYLNGIRDFFKKTYGIKETDLTNTNWESIAKGILKEAREQGIVDRKQREAINSQVQTQKYKFTLEYIQYKLRFLLAQTEEEKQNWQKKANNIARPAYNKLMQSEKRKLNSLISSINSEMGSKNVQKGEINSLKSQIKTLQNRIEKQTEKPIGTSTETPTKTPTETSTQKSLINALESKGSSKISKVTVHQKKSSS